MDVPDHQGDALVMQVPGMKLVKLSVSCSVSSSDSVAAAPCKQLPASHALDTTRENAMHALSSPND